jgi:hypothetical protein
VAAERGLAVDELLRRLIDEGVEKLEHLERSKPRARKPAGRPFDSPETGRFKELVHMLQPIYVKLRESFGEDFERVHGEDEKKLEALIQAKDLEGLEEFEKKKPWIKRKW